MSERSGEITVIGRDGSPIIALAWSAGRDAAATGRDLASAIRPLTIERLDFWLGNFSADTMLYEAGIIQAEIDRRDPHGVRGTLWQWASFDS